MLTPETVQPAGIDDVVYGSPYQSYTYSYPHKTAYRLLETPEPLTNVWRGEDQSALFLYLHVPFCEHRCGFCNLFTQANPEDGLTLRYLQQIRREAECVREALEPTANFAQLAIGGGTPTFLNERELEQLLAVSSSCGAQAGNIPVSVEVSPATVTSRKMALLASYGTDRVSSGIQSFNDEEARRLGRPQRTQDVLRALETIRTADVPILNIDLIYGGEGQSVSDWMRCVRAAVEWAPEEIYLYPLYVRPLTGLSRLDHAWDDQRLEAYREARDFLCHEGYTQISMRMFQKAATRVPTNVPQEIREYRCQADGMVGLGCGARSYTRSLHYSTEYAVGRRGVHSILLDYVNREPSSFSAARHGYQLTAEDRQRRFAIMSLLQVEGLSRPDYQTEFGDDVLHHVPELTELAQHELVAITPRRVQLTESGMERSDAIGPWLYSETVRGLMREYDLV